MTKVLRQQSPTRRLTVLYICALSSVALLAIIGQIIVQFAIQQQSSDALVINIAGRQRMLSQKITKAALIIEFTTDPSVRTTRVTELQQAVTLWKQSQEGLQHGDATLGLPGNNSAEVSQLFSVIGPNYQAMLSATQNILSVARQNQAGTSQLRSIDPSVQAILAQEGNFLVGMNQIVSQYQSESEGRVSALRTIELTLFGITLAVLVLEGSLIFRPTAQKLNQTISEIVALQHSIAEQKRELESGIQEILQTHVQTANGDFNVRAPLAQDHVLWQVAYSLNNLIARLHRLSLVEFDLQQTKREAARVVGSLQTQANQIKSELLLVHSETAQLVDALRDAKMREQPIWLPQSHTLLNSLCKELDGNYLQPALPAGRS